MSAGFFVWRNYDIIYTLSVIIKRNKYMTLKTVASLGSKKYERVGSIKLLNKILPSINNYNTRSKLRTEARKLGTSKVSLKDFTKNISKTHGSVAASRFIEAIIKRGQKDLSAKTDSAKTEKRPIPKHLRALDTSVSRYRFGGSNVRALGGVGDGEHGTASKLGVGINQAQSQTSALQKGPVGFAGNKASGSSAPKTPEAHVPMKFAA